MSFAVHDWRSEAQAHATPPWKRTVYKVLRPLIDLDARRHLAWSTLRELRPSLVTKSRGFPLEDRRAWALHGLRVRDATILVQGTGSGWDVLSWAELRPKRIIATDLVAFQPSWDEIRDHCRRTFGVAVEFHAAPLEDMPMIADGTIDLCGSDAVLEHCRDLDAVMAETRRVLRPGGHFYASFGPLWFAPGGDHFSLRFGVKDGYAHIALDPDAYQAFFQAHRQPVEDFQSGGRYVEIDLFSKLRMRDYLAAFARAGLRVADTHLEVCPRALQFEVEYPQGYAALRARWGDYLGRDDLRVRTMAVRLVRS